MVVLLFVVAFSLPVSVSANAPVPAKHLTAILSNLPDGVVYADLLIKIEENDPQFVDFQPNAFAQSASEAKELVAYSEDGFRSFTFHYKNAQSDIQIKYYNNYNNNDLYFVAFCRDFEYYYYLTQYEDLCKNYRDIKIALLDQDFNIIAVSESAQLPQQSNTLRFNGNISYDYITNAIDCSTSFDSHYVFFAILYSILIMLMSIGSETALSRFFGFDREHRRVIFIVNVCTQIAMRVLYVALPFTYLIETCILEMLIYSVEFLAYKKRFWDIRTRKLAYYTIAANTLSLILGIFLDCYILA